MEICTEAVKYFKSQEGFHRLFLGFRGRYESLGYVGGTVQLVSLRDCEKQALSGFMGRDFLKQKSATVSVEAFEKALQRTKFEGLTLQEILWEYFDGKLVWQKSVREQETLKRQQFFEGLIDGGTGDGQQWLCKVMENKAPPYNLLMQEYKEDITSLEKRLGYVFHAVDRLNVLGENSGKGVGNSLSRLAKFSTEVTGNPHFFDEGKTALVYLLHGTYFALNHSLLANVNLSAEGRAELLYNVGLAKDDISNFVVCYGINGIVKKKSKKSEYGFEQMEAEQHLGLRGFCELREPVQLSLWNLKKLTSATAFKNKVYIFENPTVFAEALEGAKDIDFSAVCSNGQINLAVLILLDLLWASGATLYYSGDFDPEGLLIADRLKQRYVKRIKEKQKFELWRFKILDYERAVSNKAISDKRLKQLDNLKDVELIELAKVLQKNKLAGYQEMLIPELLNDIMIAVR